MAESFITRKGGITNTQTYEYTVSSRISFDSDDIFRIPFDDTANGSRIKSAVLVDKYLKFECYDMEELRYAIGEDEIPFLFVSEVISESFRFSGYIYRLQGQAEYNRKYFSQSYGYVYNNGFLEFMLGRGRVIKAGTTFAVTVSYS